MISAILLGVDVEEQTEILYQSDLKGWNFNSTYSWTFSYRPTINYLSLTIEEDRNAIISNVWDGDFDGEKASGKVGMFTHSQGARFYDLSVKPLCTI